MIDLTEARLQAALERVRAGEPLTGQFMFEHGLEVPLVEHSRLEWRDGTFVLTCWAEEPIVDSSKRAGGDHDRRVQTLDEDRARAVLRENRGLRAALGLPE